jgi:hypothetical protein
MLLIGLILLEALHLVVGIRFALHSGNALEAARLINRKDQDDILHCLESIAQLPRWAVRRRPSVVQLRFL